MPKTKGTKRGAEAAADASAKKGRRASEADVALRLGDELGEHTIVSLANIILLKIAADLGCGDTIDHMAVVKNYLCLFVALLFIAKTFTENLITGTHASSKSSPSSKGSEDEDDSDDEDAARAAAPRPPSADFFCALHDLANILLALVSHIELNVFELLEHEEGFDFNARNAAPQFAHLKARVQMMGLKSKDLLGRAASCVKQTAHREEMIGMWKAFNKSLPPILMPAMLADESQRVAASEGRVFLTMNEVRNYFFSHKPESGA